MFRTVLPRLSGIRARRALLIVLVILGSAVPAGAAEPKANVKPDAAAIRATAEAFVKAFDAQDAKAVVSLWTADGSLADDRGEIFKGRKAIEEQYAAFFKQYPGAKIEIAVQAIEFPTADTAVEDGLARVVGQHSVPPTASRYTAVHVREGGKWLMASVRESGIPLPSNFSRLADLAWLIGHWQVKDEETTVDTCFRWIANKSFIRRDYSVRRAGIEVSSGTQIIGWEPAAGQITSWSFDSSGGHGTARWSPGPEGWRIESRGVLADGTPTSSRELLIRVAGEDNIFGWRSFDRKAGQVALPDTREVVLDRVPDKQ